MGVGNSDVNGGHFNMNSTTGSESNNHNGIYSKKKRYEIDTNREMENNELQYGVDMYVVLPVSTHNKYANMEYNSEHHNIFINGKIPTSNNSTVSTLTSPNITSTNDKGCSYMKISTIQIFKLIQDLLGV